jgi:glycosyltransferase involved in cell wall biosynthesis
MKEAKKRVLVVLPRIPHPARDGGALAMVEMLRLYHAMGLETHVLAYNTTRHFVSAEEQEIFRRSCGISVLKAIDIDTRLRVISLLINWVFSKKSYHLTRFYSGIMEEAVKEQLTSGAMDFVHVESLFACPFLEAIRPHIAVPVFIRTHNIEHQIWERLSGRSRGLKRWYLKCMSGRLRQEERYFLGMVDGCMHISPVDMDYFREQLPEKEHAYIPFVIRSSDEWDSEGYQQREGIGFLGSFEWDANVEGVRWFLSRVWPELRRLFPDLQFYVAGKGIDQVWRSDEVGEGVVICGEVAEASVFIRQRVLMIVPLFAGSGVRIKMLEAMALGVGMVTTGIGAQGLLPVEGEGYLIGDTEEAFKEGIVKLMAVDGFYKALCIKGWEAVRRDYSEAVCQERLKEFLGRLAGNIQGK